MRNTEKHIYGFISTNVAFSKIKNLLGLHRTQGLIEQIFASQGIEATKSKIHGWECSPGKNRSSPMPEDILLDFIQGLFEYRDQKRNEGINIFNFEDTRPKK